MVLAARGARETESGVEPVTDAAVADALRRRARGVWMKTFAATIATGAVLYALG